MTRLFVDHLTVVDSSVLDARRGLLGESWIVDLEVGGDLDAQGMVLDFGRIKPLAKAVIDGTVDHVLLVPGEAPNLDFERDGTAVALRWRYDGAEIRLRSPPEAVCVLPAAEISAPVVAAALETHLAEALPGSIHDIRVALREEAIDGAFYRYSHGLKHHDGNCQRIAHGHRSRIQIYRDGERAADLESAWAQRWRDIYLGTESDVLARDGDRLRFGYSAAQGAFDLEIDARRCELLPGESTVERIAEFIAGELKRQAPGHSYRVRAFEGVRKGAVAES